MVTTSQPLPTLWILTALLTGCTADAERPRYGDKDTGSDTGGDTGEAPVETAQPAEYCGACPCDAIGVGDGPAYCIDAYEDLLYSEYGNLDQGPDYPDGSTLGWPKSLPDVMPSINVSWYQAVAMCENVGKRLCTMSEWQDACDGQIGEGGALYPWGESPEPDRVCAAPNHLDVSDYATLQRTGSLPDCRTPSGVYDQVGNAWEWVDPEQTDEDGRPVAAKVGGAYYLGYGSTACGAPPITDHPPEFEGTIAVRCCADAH